MKVRVLLADDHPVFRDGLRFVLAQAEDLLLVDEVDDGVQAVRRALRPTEGEEPVDLVVMDVRMPLLDGVAATRQIHDADGPPVLVLTMFEDDATVLSAVRAGASGYLVKGADAGQVLSALRAVAEGHAVFGPSLAAGILDYFAAKPTPRRSCRRCRPGRARSSPWSPRGAATTRSARRCSSRRSRCAIT